MLYYIIRQHKFFVTIYNKKTPNYASIVGRKIVLTNKTCNYENNEKHIIYY